MNKGFEDQTVFEVLGQTLRLKKDEALRGVTPEEIVSLVQTEASNILRKTPNLSEEQLAVLVALKIAGDKRSLENEYRENVEQFKTLAQDTLQIISVS